MNGTGTEADISGHQHAGSYRDEQPTKVTLPNGDSAAEFNGSSEYLTIPSSAVFSISTTHRFTWEGWIRPDVLQFPHPADSTGYVDWMGKCENYSPSCEWEARMYSTQTSEGRPNRVAAYAFNPSAGLGSGADWQPSAGLIQAGRWLFVVGEYQTDSNAGDPGCGTPVGTIDIWVNGVNWDQAAHGDTGCMSQYGVSPQAGSSPVNIGTMAFDSWFPGAVGKVAFFDSLLSQQQIDAQCTSMTGLAPSGSCTDTCTLSHP
jgi:hypothetical protein